MRRRSLRFIGSRPSEQTQADLLVRALHEFAASAQLVCEQQDDLVLLSCQQTIADDLRVFCGTEAVADLAVLQGQSVRWISAHSLEAFERAQTRLARAGMGFGTRRSTMKIPSTMPPEVIAEVLRAAREADALSPPYDGVEWTPDQVVEAVVRGSARALSLAQSLWDDLAQQGNEPPARP